MIARGQLQHHFWGTYAASIVLQFETEYCAGRAQQTVLTMFSPHPSESRALQYHGSGMALRTVEALLKRLGADPAKLGSVARSIDFGEPFTIDVVLSDGSTQTTLPLEG